MNQLQTNPGTSTPGEQIPAVPVTPSGDPPALSAPPGLDLIFHVLRRRWQWIVAGGCVAALLAALVTWLVVPGRYSAQMVIEVRSHGTGEDDLASAQRAQAYTLKDSKVLEGALDREQLAPLYQGQSRQDLMAWLDKEMVIDFPAGQTVTRVVLTGDRPEYLAATLEAVADSYQKKSDERDAGRRQKEKGQLEKERADTSKSLRKLQYELGDTEKRLGYVSKEDVKARGEDIRHDLEKVNGDRRTFQATLRKAVADWCDALVMLEKPDSITVNPADVDALFEKQASYQTLQVEEAAAAKGLSTALRVTGKDDAPEVRKARQRVADVQNQILAMRAQIGPELEKKLREKIVADLRHSLSRLENEAAQAHTQDDAQAAEVQRLETAAKNLVDSNRADGRKFDEVHRLEEEVQTAENTLKKINDRIADNQLAPVTPARLILQEPSTPTSARNDRRLKFTVGAGALAFFMVFLGVVLVEYSGRRVYSGEDVSRGLSLPVIGKLPSVSTNARRPLADDAATVPPEQEALLAAVDALRTTILHAGQKRPLRVVMVTSAGMGEGKTSLAIQLAASLARSWRRVLLVDGDLRHPSVHQHFNVTGAPGLSEILRGEVHGDEAVQATSLNRLSLLPAGRCDRHALEALAQESLGDVFAGFKDLYDFVILDVGPVMPVSDALQFGHHVDGVLLSVLRDVTRLPDLWAARQRLSGLNIPILGAVVVGGKPTVYGGVNPAPLRLNG